MKQKYSLPQQITPFTVKGKSFANQFLVVIKTPLADEWIISFFSD